MSALRRTVQAYWSGPGGGREVLLLAYPLILSNMSFTLQTFVDRLFLTWYSAEALAGAPAGRRLTVLERFVEIYPPHAQCRDEAERDARHKRDQCGEHQNT